jgi:CBS-domain-containing membrane protein
LLQRKAKGGSMKTFTNPVTHQNVMGQDLRAQLRAAFGAGVGIAILALLSQWVQQPLLIAPLGASAALLFALPASPLSQPRAVIGGHLVAAAVGLFCVALFGHGWYVSGIAVGLAVAAMLLTKTLHAPAGATPLVVLTLQPNLNFLITPILLGSALLVASAWAYHKFFSTHSYPHSWWRVQ